MRNKEIMIVILNIFNKYLGFCCYIFNKYFVIDYYIDYYINYYLDILYLSHCLLDTLLY